MSVSELSEILDGLVVDGKGDYDVHIKTLGCVEGCVYSVQEVDIDNNWEECFIEMV